jgi:lysophospholipase L1-like esterase
LNLGEPRTISPQTVAFSIGESSSYPDGIVIPLTDPKVRLLGGIHLNGPSYPLDGFKVPQAVNTRLPLVPTSQYSGSRYGLVTGLEFVLAVGQSEFELYFHDSGRPTPIEMAIDGRLINDDGIPVSWRNDGSLRHMRFVLPAAGQNRRITVYANGNPFGHVKLPAGGSLVDLPSGLGTSASIVFEGDSITEGAVASRATKFWPLHAAMRLGVRNPIVVGVGSSGYLSKRPDNAAIPARIANVLEAVNGGPPDAVVLAAGINDCSVAPPAPFPLAEVQAAALAYFKALRAAAPDMVIIVLGPFTDYNAVPYSATSQACRDAIFEAARQVPMTYTVDVSDWVTFANRDIVFDGNTYGPHPVDSGHAIYGQRAAEAISSIIRGL